MDTYERVWFRVDVNPLISTVNNGRFSFHSINRNDDSTLLD